MFAAVVLVCTCAGISLRGQSGALNGEWRAYGGDTGHTRYAPLDQIDAANFSKLTVAWRFKTDHLGPRPEFMFQSTPVMANGVLYSTAGSRRAVVALDPETGEELWMHSEREGPRGAAAPRQLSGRGLAYWTDGKEERILYVTPGYQLVALNAKTGMRVPTFGDDGIVDLKQNNDQQIDPLSGEIGLHATPTVAGNVVVVGAAHRSGGVPTGKTNVKGYIRGFDVRTGKRLWIFHTIPPPGEFGNETWLKDSWSYTGNTGAWGQISIDPELQIAYLPVESATGDYFGADRPGNNLFAESLVAVDLQTGKRKWHFQLVHHGIWDHDIPCAPILVDIRRDGKIIKAVAQPTKQAFMYVFDRVTGQPLWPIEERPVPKGDVPGEYYAPTQPFPLERTRPAVQVRLAGIRRRRSDRLHARAARRRAEGHLEVQDTVRSSRRRSSAKPKGPLATLALASAGGGTNWPGGSYDPETNILYVNSQKSVSQLGLVPPRDPSKNDLAYVVGNALTGARTTGGAGSAAGGEQRRSAGNNSRGGGRRAGGRRWRRCAGAERQGLPIMKPPYGQFSAIDLAKGEILWQVPHGETPDAIRNHPALKGLNIPRTGRPGVVGSLTTKTLVISGEAGFGPTPTGARGAMLRAYDKATGKEVGAVYLPAPQTGSPMTYMLNGRQYIVVAVSGAGYSGELIAFRLPS